MYTIFRLKLWKAKTPSNVIVYRHPKMRVCPCIADIFSDAHERIYYKVADGRCSTRCHKDAFCSCGTVGGRYVCACKAGFSGNGINCERKYFGCKYRPTPPPATNPPH